MRKFIALTLFLTQSTFAAPATTPFPKILEESALKTNVDPCEDFYQFSCGTWLDHTLIPADKELVARQATPMQDSVDIRLNEILQDYAHGQFKIPSTYATKLADFYSSCMTADQQSEEALKMLRIKMLQIKRTVTPTDFAVLLADLEKNGVGLFGFNSMQDLNDSTVVLAEISQSGMGLQNPAYYQDSDAKAIEIRETYKKYIAQIFTLIGAPKEQVQKIAETILRIETQAASKAYSITDQSNPQKLNHVMSVTQLKQVMPSFDWMTFLKTLGVSRTKFNVDEPEFLLNMDKMLAQMPATEKFDYLSWLLADHYASIIGGKMAQAHFDFWEKYLTGAKTMKPRWKICTRVTSKKMGYPLAEAYVKTFNGQAIAAKTNSMIDEIKNIFLADLTVLSTGVGAWIDGTTVQEAVKKAQSIQRKVGAPVKFLNYNSLTLSKTNYFENYSSVSLFDTRRDLAKIGRPVDKTEWEMMPWEVNAYYDRPNNQFVFPFGILQPPSLDLTASDGANYGSFGGGTIGHELTHGFDSQGSKYDSAGNLKQWWTVRTQKSFDEKAKCFVDQANQFTIKSMKLNVNGPQTLEENLADQGGVKLGYMALDKILKTRPEGTPWLGKFSERQQYWLAYAQSWCLQQAPESLRKQMTDDVHPAPEFRVNAVMMNRPEFAADFKCSAGKPMAPVNRCTIW